MKPPCPHCLGRHTTVGAAMICADLAREQAKEYREVHDAHHAATYTPAPEPVAVKPRRRVITIQL